MIEERLPLSFLFHGMNSDMNRRPWIFEPPPPLLFAMHCFAVSKTAVANYAIYRQVFL
jgi:hypothetical protein